MPEAPRLHFLGAVWFRTLLVNSRQPADTVYAEVGRLLRQMDKEKGVETLEIDSSTPLGVFACNQIFWVPDQRNLADNWHVYWKHAMRMGFELVDAGLRTGVAWDHGQFLTALDALRNQIRDAMFSGPAIASVGKEKTAASEKIGTVLQGILQKWQADSVNTSSQPGLEVTPEYPDIDETIIMSPAAEQPTSSSERGVTTTADMHAMDKPGSPPDGTDGDADIQETVIFSSADPAPPSDSTQARVEAPPLQESQWDDDQAKTVVMRTDSSELSPRAASAEDDMDRTVIISAPFLPPGPGASPLGDDDDLAATMVQNAPGPPPSPSGGFDGDLEATVVLKAGGLPDAKKEAPPGDDKDDIMEQTIIIRPDVKKE